MSKRFGFKPGFDLECSDLNIGEGRTSFKLNYEGNSIPLRLEGELSREQVEELLAVVMARLETEPNLIKVVEGIEEGWEA